MEIKKNPQVDLQNKRFLFLEIGFAVALLATIGALCYTARENKIEQIQQVETVVEEEITEITRQDVKQPEPIRRTEIKVFSDALSIVTNDEKITTDVNFDEFSEDMAIDVIPVKPVVEEVIEDDQPFMKVEKMPSFRGGDLMTFRNWVNERLRYPQIAQENSIQGRVLISFVIERDGSLTNIKVLQTPDSSLSDEVIRVVKSSPKWSPGKQGDKTVRVKYTMPTDFRIQN